MALIAFPEEAWVTNIALSVERPGQAVLRTPSGTKVYDVSQGRFFAEVTLGNVPHDETRKVAAFLDALNGSEHWFELPVYEDAEQTAGRSVTATVASGKLRFNSQAAARAFRIGDVIRIGTRCYRFTEENDAATVSSTLAVLPAPVFASSQAVVWNGVKMLLRLTEPAPRSYRSPHFGGPWTLLCEEVV